MTDEEFMEIVHEYRAVWDRGCRDFKEKDKKKNAWEEIGTRSGLGAVTAEKKYSLIRSTFGRYLASVKPASGAGRDSVNIETKWEHLRWLMPFIKHRPGASSNINASKNNNNERGTSGSGSSNTETADDEPVVVSEENGGEPEEVVGHLQEARANSRASGSK